MSKILISYSPEGGLNNFHNMPDLKLFITGNPVIGPHGTVYPISPAQAGRVERHFCGFRRTCNCPAGGLVYPGSGYSGYGLPAEFVALVARATKKTAGR
jgi:hypothetical protein